MKDMTNRELLDAIESAMRTVAERFRAQREAEAGVVEQPQAQPAKPAPAG